MPLDPPPRAKNVTAEAAQKAAHLAAKHAEWVQVLEKAFGRKVSWSCEHCLEEAFIAVTHGKSGYVTDDELIEASGGRLEHK